MIKYFLSISVIFLLSFNVFSQIKVETDLDGGNSTIGDATISLEVSGGEPPYKYVWSNSGTSWYSSYASGLNEGSEYTITVFDSKGDSTVVKATVEPNSAPENMNATMIPIVGLAGDIVFWDPFSTFGYDGTIYIDEAKISAPLAKDSLYDYLILSEWRVADGAQVDKGQVIAEMTSNRGPIHLYAIGNGIVEHISKVGDTLKWTHKVGKKNEVTVKGVDVANMKYSEPQPMINANGDNKSNSIPLVVIWLVAGAIFFTIYMKFINFRGAKHAIELVQGKYDDPKDEGEVSHFQALTTALSGTVGLGNIAGVALAVAAGGAGATFWMIVAGLLGMASKFVECTLGVKYRNIDEDDAEVHGGPMYYLSKGLGKRGGGWVIFGKILAGMFALLCIGGSFGGGNMFQANQAFAQFAGAIGGWPGGGVIFGVIMAILVGIVIIGGIKSIAKVTDKIVPLMVGIYVLFALIIIFMNIGNIGAAFSAIFGGAFSPEAMYGGFIGVLVIGFQRAAFSNEAGVGSASIAHSAAKTSEPVSEGIVALLEPFIDTVIVCTMTALVLIFTGFTSNPDGLAGAELTSAAFSSEFDWFKYVLTAAIILFAFSTMVSWSYYGLQAWMYLFGDSKAMEIGYKVIFCLMVILGSSVGLGAVLDFSDIMVLGMAFPNILGMIFLAPEVKRDMIDYFARIKSGAIKKFK